MLECRAISQTYGENAILSDVSLRIEDGEVHQIFGPSGGGKTTLLRILCLLEGPTTGTVLLDGQQYRFKDIFSRDAWTDNAIFRDAVTLVSQQIFLWPHLTCRENIEAVGGVSDHYRPLTEQLEVAHCLDRYPNQVSVGQRQRIALIRGFATRARYLILDEVTSALDQRMSSVVVGMLEHLASTGTGIAIVTHRIYDWSRAPQSWWIEHGRLQCQTTIL